MSPEAEVETLKAYLAAARTEAERWKQVAENRLHVIKNLHAEREAAEPDIDHQRHANVRPCCNTPWEENHHFACPKEPDDE